MPHQKIYANSDPTATWTGDVSALDHPGVVVQWNPTSETDIDGAVGVATGDLNRQYDPETHAESVRDACYVWLTRSEINSLIQALRRARDAQFGKDQ